MYLFPLIKMKIKLTVKSEILNTVNNKLLVRGIFCDLEKMFDCGDDGIIFSKFNFFGCKGKDHALYQSYLDNRYFRTAIYNDNDNSNKVWSWAKVGNGVPQGCVLGPLLFLHYVLVNNLPKIINTTSAPTIIADDTSILFAHSDLIHFNKNVHIFFETLNECFKSSQLSLNFNKTNYIHFGTKRNMSINLKVGLNNNLITNSSDTKFLGLTMDFMLSLNNHIEYSLLYN